LNGQARLPPSGKEILDPGDPKKRISPEALDKFGKSRSVEFIFIFTYVFNISEKGIYRQKCSKGMKSIPH